MALTNFRSSPKGFSSPPRQSMGILEDHNVSKSEKTIFTQTQSFATKTTTTNNPSWNVQPNEHTIIFTSASAVNVYLPLAASFPGRQITLKRRGAGFVTVNRSGSDTIDGSNQTYLNSVNDSGTYVSDGVNGWFKVALNIGDYVPASNFDSLVRTYLGNIGIILMYSGPHTSIPDGWSLCDGTNGTPDLRDRFIVGSGNVYSTGDQGGSTDHTHNFTSNVVDVDQLTPNIQVLELSTIDTANHLPPYYALAYIMNVSG
jgi:hypothetical protein